MAIDLREEELYVPSSTEVRTRIESIPEEDIRMPSPSVKFPNGVRLIPGRLVKITDRLCLLGGFRISEVCTKFSGESNSSNTMKVFVDTHKATGEEVLRIQVKALKKGTNVTINRDIGVPLDPRHEPLSKLVLESWEEAGGNPCAVSRQGAWFVNSRAFYGMGYNVGTQVVYERDAEKKLIRTENGKPKINKVINEHKQPGANHFLRHIRAIELRDLQLTPEERVSFFKWSARGVGLNPMLLTYSQPEWFEYFPKFLKRTFSSPA